jgi:hypothetical protein
LRTVRGAAAQIDLGKCWYLAELKHSFQMNVSVEPSKKLAGPHQLSVSARCRQLLAEGVGYETCVSGQSPDHIPVKPRAMPNFIFHRCIHRHVSGTVRLTEY